MSSVLKIESVVQKHYEVIDYLKGFSILTIVSMHLIQTYTTFLPGFVIKLATAGGTGVHIFILCSGFGLYLSYMRRPCGFGDFIRHRFGKIYIPYIVIITISALVPFMYDGNKRILAYLSHVLLFKMFVPEFESSFGAHFWYISTIFQFYFCFIPLSRLKEKLQTKKFLILSLAVSFLWWIFLAVSGLYEIRVWDSFFIQYLWEFSLGMCLADYLGNGRIIHIKMIYLVITACTGLGLATVVASFGGVFKVFNDIPGMIGYGSLALVLYEINIKTWNGLILWISEFSYEWYLIHILIFACFFKSIHADTLSMQLTVGVIAFIVSILLAIGYKKCWQLVRR